MIKLSAVIITFNEEEHLAKCLSSLEGVADEIIVVDSFSTDKTIDICYQYNAKVIKQKFLGYKEQKNFAIEQATNDYILSLDGDEALSNELKSSIKKVKSNWQSEGYLFNRRNNFCGQWINHSDWYPDKKLRLFKKGSGMWKGINPHDIYVLHSGKTAKKLKGDLHHWIYGSYSEYNLKMEHFSSISAEEYHKLGRSASSWTVFYRSSWAFFKAYFLRRGFLDGFNGLFICIQTGHYTFLKYSKLKELNRLKK